MGCGPSQPPAYGEIVYCDKKVLLAQLRVLTVATDPMKWKLAYVQASTRIAHAHGMVPIPVEVAFSRADVIVIYAHVALLELRLGSLVDLRGFCT